MAQRSPHGSRAFVALLLSCVLLVLSACDLTQRAEEVGSPSKHDEPSNNAEVTRAAEDQNPAVKATAQEMDTVFIHRASEENSRGDYTYLKDPSIDGDPDAVVMATVAPDLGSTGEGSYDHNIGVWYESRAKRWAIFNQDLAPVPGGTTFQVVVPGESEKFVHKARPQNITKDSTYLDDPLVDGKPDAIFSVTQNWNPGGGPGTYNNHPVDVRYDAGRERWAIFNTDGSKMPNGAAFNVAVSEVPQATSNNADGPTTDQDKESAEKAEPGSTEGQELEPSEGSNQGETGDVAKVDEGARGFPKYRDFLSEGNPETPAKLVSSESSAGAIPVISPFNFGRDPGGPEDKTLYLTIPKLGLEDIPAFDTVSEEKLRGGTVHIPATGYPWQEGANVYIAGHRVGYEGTLSYYVFFRLDELVEGDEILLEDSAGGQYTYRVSRQLVVGPNSVDVMNAVDGKSLVTLQTCTLPDYKERLIVQGELVEKKANSA